MDRRIIITLRCSFGRNLLVLFLFRVGPFFGRGFGFVSFFGNFFGGFISFRHLSWGLVCLRLRCGRRSGCFVTLGGAALSAGGTFRLTAASLVFTQADADRLVDTLDRILGEEEFQA